MSIDNLHICKHLYLQNMFINWRISRIRIKKKNYSSGLRTACAFDCYYCVSIDFPNEKINNKYLVGCYSKWSNETKINSVDRRSKVDRGCYAIEENGPLGNSYLISLVYKYFLDSVIHGNTKNVFATSNHIGMFHSSQAYYYKHASWFVFIHFQCLFGASAMALPPKLHYSLGEIFSFPLMASKF